MAGRDRERVWGLGGVVGNGEGGGGGGGNGYNEDSVRAERETGDREKAGVTNTTHKNRVFHAK